MIHRQRDGFILVLTLVVLSLIVVIASQLYYLSIGYSSFSRVSVRKEQAKLLALSGVRIAQSQLFVEAKKEKEGKPLPQAAQGAASKPQQQKPTQQDQGDLRLLEQVLPALNRWSTVEFTEKKDGLAGTVSTYLAAEDGKIHLNILLAMMTQKGLPQKNKDMLMGLWKLIGKAAQAKGDLYVLATDFFERRNKVWLNDVTELLDARGFKFFDGKVFVHMPNSKKSAEKAVYLTDIFTPQSRYGKLDPWVFSASVRDILGLKPPSVNKTVIATLIKEGKTRFNWKEDWDKYLKPLYGKEFKSLPKDIDMFLAPQFNPMGFSVVSYGKVQDVVQGVYAIFARKKDQDGNILFVPIKIYWL